MLSFHMRGVHRDPEPLRCKGCGQEGFQSYGTYYKHVKQKCPNLKKGAGPNEKGGEKSMGFDVKQLGTKYEDN